MPSAVLDQLDTFGPHACRQVDYPQAASYTRKLARSHSENFTVISWLLPRQLREDFHHIYAFCRWADDLGDETGDPKRSVELLSWWRSELDACYAGNPRHPVYVALQRTIERHAIGRQPFNDLIDAFIQDQTVRRYENWDEVLDYCTRSANPVGRLVLWVWGYQDQQRRRLADATCTALQLANFWQDVRRDVLQRGRVYLPALVARRHGLDLEQMVALIGAQARGRTADFTPLMPAYRATLQELCGRTWPMFAEGRKLWPLVDRSLRVDLELFTRGGEAVLGMIRRLDFDTLERRPALGRCGKLLLILRAAAGHLWHPGPARAGPPG